MELDTNSDAKFELSLTDQIKVRDMTNELQRFYNNKNLEINNKVKEVQKIGKVHFYEIFGFLLAIYVLVLFNFACSIPLLLCKFIGKKDIGKCFFVYQIDKFNDKIFVNKMSAE